MSRNDYACTDWFRLCNSGGAIQNTHSLWSKTVPMLPPPVWPIFSTVSRHKLHFLMISKTLNSCPISYNLVLWIHTITIYVTTRSINKLLIEMFVKPAWLSYNMLNNFYVFAKIGKSDYIQLNKQQICCYEENVQQWLPFKSFSCQVDCKRFGSSPCCLFIWNENWKAFHFPQCACHWGGTEVVRSGLQPKPTNSQP